MGPNTEPWGITLSDHTPVSYLLQLSKAQIGGAKRKRVPSHLT